MRPVIRLCVILLALLCGLLPDVWPTHPSGRAASLGQITAACCCGDSCLDFAKCDCIGSTPAPLVPLTDVGQVSAGIRLELTTSPAVYWSASVFDFVGNVPLSRERCYANVGPPRRSSICVWQT